MKSMSAMYEGSVVAMTRRVDVLATREAVAASPLPIFSETYLADAAGMATCVSVPRIFMKKMKNVTFPT